MSTASAGPLSGYVLEVVRNDRSTTLWWGEGADGGDVVATRSGRVLTWMSPEACFAAAAVEGWEVAHDEVTRMDLTPALEWLARRRALDAEAALNAWNLAGDMARSTGTPWGDRGRVADACHDKLTVACVPWLVGQDDCSPRWTVTEERYLRRRVGAAIALVAQQVAGRRHLRP
ncbi:hypothetical protein H9623_14015 [Oerskovia sp. Sa1BUA8]|uniref:Uncharacterized protein n=1 Tax=Oerskovia douganii TaxID=2762210 RepID=A0A9D5Z0Q4_9CELL|nr:hypothetical protein [Oerskovia douganii]MBE7701409.1 hypothetical protein [Oerskovia douganii]